MNSEIHKWARLWCVVVLMLFLMGIALVKYNSQQTAKGIAISNYLSTYHSIDLPPDQARYFNIAFTGVDIAIDSLDIFPTTIKARRK